MFNLITSYGFEFGMILFIIGFLAFQSVSGRKENLIMLIIAQELILLGIGILFIHVSFLLDDKNGALFALQLLPLAGAESAIALAIYISYYPMRETMIVG